VFVHSVVAVVSAHTLNAPLAASQPRHLPNQLIKLQRH